MAFYTKPLNFVSNIGSTSATGAFSGALSTGLLGGIYGAIRDDSTFGSGFMTGAKWGGALGAIGNPMFSFGLHALENSARGFRGSIGQTYRDMVANPLALFTNQYTKPFTMIKGMK